ncbi:MAG: hypothetical protein HDR24_13705 [Lachnospiraceae bacterium]|nr:hypothetical protein [Lachnospiraceae bacterium]
MAKKRSCRRTETEDKIHDKAVKMRKMTDEQLVNYVNNRVEKAENDGFNRGKCFGGGKSISDFVKELSELRGIGAATVSKIKAYAEEMGYMEGNV